jgi:integrase
LRRCCQNEEGRQYGSHCPKLKSYPQHGTWGYHLSHGSDPKTANGASSAKPDSPPNREAASALAELKTRLDKGALFELAVVTGLRGGEICALHWSDVDFVARTIGVRPIRVSVDGRVQETTTKNQDSLRPP